MNYRVIYIIMFIFIETFLVSSMKGQTNLVPNPSFENIDTCNFGNGGVLFGHVSPWDTPNASSPDLFNTCASYTICQVPSNNFGFQYPHTGNGYVGECFYLNTGFREYIQVKLDTDLIANKTYCASFYVSLSNYANIATNNFGMYFSPSHTYTSSNMYLNFSPQINYTSVITDTLDWTLISGSFMASGGERYLIIGNFYSNANTDTSWVSHQTGGNSSYYFIDDINVHCTNCSEQGIDELNNASTYKLYPNPNTGSMTLEYTMEGTSSAVFNIYDIAGRLVKRLMIDANSKTVNVDATDLNSGVYYYTVNENGKKVKTEKLVIVK